MTNRLKNTSGFTLVEILASVVLLTVVISLFLSMFPQMANINNKNGENLDAANVGKELLVKYKNYNNSNDNVIKNTVLNALPPVNTSTVPKVSTYKYDNFDIVVTIFPNADVSGTAQTLYRIQIEVKENGHTLTTTHGYLNK